MARNPDKRRCVVEGCRAWAKRGSERCASHSRRAAVGAPKGNRNALKHGYYRSQVAVPEVLTVPTIEDEISLLAARRDAVDRWLRARMEAGEDVDVLRYLALLGQISSRIARMLQARKALGGHGDVIVELFSAALDEVAAQAGIDVEL